MDTTSLRGRLVAVTGAASGIGEATAREAARRGADVAICDINPARLAEVERSLAASGTRVVSSVVDVASRDAVAEFARKVLDETDGVDILVNNAGVTLAASALDTTPEDWDWVLGVNLMGVIHGCEAFAPAMRDRGSGGHVVNIASMDGYSAMEGFAAYSTAKYAVVGYSESLRAELAHHDIGVSVICPGPIATNITTNLDARGRFAGTYQERIKKESKKGTSPDRVARAVFKSVQRNRAICPVTPLAWMTYYMKRIIPNTTAKMLDRVEQEFLETKNA